MISLISIFSKKSPFDLVKNDYEALTYHYSRYRQGDRDILATQCFQMIESRAQQQKDD